MSKPSLKSNQNIGSLLKRDTIYKPWKELNRNILNQNYELDKSLCDYFITVKTPQPKKGDLIYDILISKKHTIVIYQSILFGFELIILENQINADNNIEYAFIRNMGIPYEFINKAIDEERVILNHKTTINSSRPSTFIKSPKNQQNETNLVFKPKFYLLCGNLILFEGETKIVLFDFGKKKQTILFTKGVGTFNISILSVINEKYQKLRVCQSRSYIFCKFGIFSEVCYFIIEENYFSYEKKSDSDGGINPNIYLKLRNLTFLDKNIKDLLVLKFVDEGVSSIKETPKSESSNQNKLPPPEKLIFYLLIILKEDTVSFYVSDSSRLSLNDLLSKIEYEHKHYIKLSTPMPNKINLKNSNFNERKSNNSVIFGNGTENDVIVEYSSIKIEPMKSNSENRKIFYTNYLYSRNIIAIGRHTSIIFFILSTKTSPFQMKVDLSFENYIKHIRHSIAEVSPFLQNSNSNSSNQNNKKFNFINDLSKSIKLKKDIEKKQLTNTNNLYKLNIHQFELKNYNISMFNNVYLCIVSNLKIIVINILSSEVVFSYSIPIKVPNDEEFEEKAIKSPIFTNIYHYPEMNNIFISTENCIYKFRWIKCLEILTENLDNINNKFFKVDQNNNLFKNFEEFNKDNKEKIKMLQKSLKYFNFKEEVSGCIHCNYNDLLYYTEDTKDPLPPKLSVEISSDLTKKSKSIKFKDKDKDKEIKDNISISDNASKKSKSTSKKKKNQKMVEVAEVPINLLMYQAKGKHCSNCSLFAYCCDSVQKLHWRESHFIECFIKILITKVESKSIDEKDYTFNLITRMIEIFEKLLIEVIKFTRNEADSQEMLIFIQSIKRIFEIFDVSYYLNNFTKIMTILPKDDEFSKLELIETKNLIIEYCFLYINIKMLHVRYSVDAGFNNIALDSLHNINEISLVFKKDKIKQFKKILNQKIDFKTPKKLSDKIKLYDLLQKHQSKFNRGSLQIVRLPEWYTEAANNFAFLLKDFEEVDILLHDKFFIYLLFLKSNLVKLNHTLNVYQEENINIIEDICSYYEYVYPEGHFMLGNLYFYVLFYLIKINKISICSPLLHKITQITTDNNNFELLCKAHFNLGVIYYAQNLPDHCIHQLEQAHRVCRTNHISYNLLIQILETLTLAYISKKSFRKAYPLIQECLGIRTNNSAENEANNLKIVKLKIYLNFIIDYLEYEFYNFKKSKTWSNLDLIHNKEFNTKKEFNHLIDYIINGNDVSKLIKDLTSDTFLTVMDFLYSMSKEELHQLSEDNKIEKKSDQKYDNINQDKKGHAKDLNTSLNNPNEKTDLISHFSNDNNESNLNKSVLYQDERVQIAENMQIPNYVEEIEFKKVFLNNLSKEQRETFQLLNSSQFKRSVILRDPSGPIDHFNLNYHPEHAKKFQNIIENIRSNYLLREVSKHHHLDIKAFKLLKDDNILEALSKYMKLKEINTLIETEKFKGLSSIIKEGRNDDDPDIKRRSSKYERKILYTDFLNIMLEKINFTDNTRANSILYSVYDKLEDEQLIYLMNNPNTLLEFMYNDTVLFNTEKREIVRRTIKDTNYINNETFHSASKSEVNSPIITRKGNIFNKLTSGDIANLNTENLIKKIYMKRCKSLDNDLPDKDVDSSQQLPDSENKSILLMRQKLSQEIKKTVLESKLSVAMIKVSKLKFGLSTDEINSFNRIAKVIKKQRKNSFDNMFFKENKFTNIRNNKIKKSTKKQLKFQFSDKLKDLSPNKSLRNSLNSIVIASGLFENFNFDVASEVKMKRSNTQSIIHPSLFNEFKVEHDNNKKKSLSQLNVNKYKNKVDKLKQIGSSKLIHKFEINPHEENSEEVSKLSDIDTTDFERQKQKASIAKINSIINYKLDKKKQMIKYHQSPKQKIEKTEIKPVTNIKQGEEDIKNNALSIINNARRVSNFNSGVNKKERRSIINVLNNNINKPTTQVKSVLKIKKNESSQEKIIN